MSTLLAPQPLSVEFLLLGLASFSEPIERDMLSDCLYLGAVANDQEFEWTSRLGSPVSDELERTRERAVDGGELFQLRSAGVSRYGLTGLGLALVADVRERYPKLARALDLEAMRMTPSLSAPEVVQCAAALHFLAARLDTDPRELGATLPRSPKSESVVAALKLLRTLELS